MLIGLAVGLPLTFAVARFLGSQLYGMSPSNPVVTLVAMLAFGFVTLAASVTPAVRAGSISPSDALRTE